LQVEEPASIRRVLKVGGAELPGSYSNHTMTGKQLPRLGIPGDRRIPHIDDGVLDIGMAQPVLHERHVGPRVEQMHRNRVAQRMKPPLGLRNVQPCHTYLAHQIMPRSSLSPVFPLGKSPSHVYPTRHNPDMGCFSLPVNPLRKGEAYEEA
jgi:hypothetical protein